jgi:mRNA interferase RelE/StbE
MTYQVRVKPSAVKDLNKLLSKDRDRIIIVLRALSVNPFIGKKLKGEYKDYYSVRAWPYRIIYSVYKKELLILVIHIGHRQNVYK